MDRGAQAVEQAQPVEPQSFIFAIDRHLVEEGIDGRAQTRERLHGGFEILSSATAWMAAVAAARSAAARSRSSSATKIVRRESLQIRGGFRGARLLLFGAQNIGGAAIAGEKIGAVVGVEETAERFDAANDEKQIVLFTETEDRIDQIMPRALVAQIDLQPIGEEGQNRSEEIAARGAEALACNLKSFRR